MKCSWCGGRSYAKPICKSCEEIINGIDDFLKRTGEKGQLFILEQYFNSLGIKMHDGFFMDF